VDAHERRRVGPMHVAHHQSDGLFQVNPAIGESKTAFETVDTERPVFGWKVGFGCLGQFELRGRLI
jgi:hypothetical protein